VKFSELKMYLEEISALEFLARDFETTRLVARLKGELNSRGILISSITVQRLADFFYSEYEARSNFVMSFIISHAGKLDFGSEADLVTEAKTFFQSISKSVETKNKSIYDEAQSQIRSDLQNHTMLKEIDEGLMQKMENVLRKNNLYIELEYKACSEVKPAGKEVLLLRPSIYGIGVDLKELWAKIFKI
jgi:hypothetical protein